MLHFVDLIFLFMLFVVQPIYGSISYKKYLNGIAAGMETQADMIEDIFRKNNAREVRLAKDDAERNQIWMIRKRSIGALGRLSPNYYTQDAVVPRTTLPYVLKRIYEIGEKHDLKIGNVFHAGDGNLHPVVSYDERVEGMTARVMAACDDIMATALEVGGALTGEHGIGYEKRNYMLKTFTEDDLDVMKRLRRVFDPEELCNPDKVFPSGAGCGEVGVRHRQIVL